MIIILNIHATGDFFVFSCFVSMFAGDFYTGVWVKSCSPVL